MNKKERIARLLSKLNPEDLEELESVLSENLEEEVEEDEVEDQTPPNQHQIRGPKPNRRRGKGRRNTNQPQSKGKKRKENRTAVKSKQRACRILPFETGDRDNKFHEILDNPSLDPAEQAELAQAAEADKADRKVRSSRAKKRPNPMVEVRCHTCGEVEQVSGSLVSNASRYKCNSCSGSACG